MDSKVEQELEDIYRLLNMYNPGTLLVQKDLIIGKDISMILLNT